MSSPDLPERKFAPRSNPFTGRLPGRTARQCRERWAHYPNPGVRPDPWTAAEDRLLIEMVNEEGFAWATIAHWFRGRSDNAIKNR
jgi:hypothetical protein